MHEAQRLEHAQSLRDHNKDIARRAALTQGSSPQRSRSLAGTSLLHRPSPRMQRDERAGVQGEAHRSRALGQLFAKLCELRVAGGRNAGAVRHATARATPERRLARNTARSNEALRLKPSCAASRSTSARASLKPVAGNYGSPYAREDHSERFVSSSAMLRSRVAYLNNFGVPLELIAAIPRSLAPCSTAPSSHPPGGMHIRSAW